MKLNSYEILAHVTLLLSQSPFYRDQTLKNIQYRFVPAIRHGKIRYYMIGKRMFGFVTWAYLTEQEARHMNFDGQLVYQREDGEQLWIMDLVATQDVLYICRNMCKYLKETTKHDQFYWSREESSELQRRGITKINDNVSRETYLKDVADG